MSSGNADAYSKIKFQWDIEKKQLTIQTREGEFKGVLTERTFNIQLIGKNGRPKTVAYKDDLLQISFN